MPPRPNPTPADLVAAFQRGGVSEVLKQLLVVKGISPKGKKDLGGHFGSPHKPTEPAAATNRVDQLSPGEVPRSGKDFWFMLVLAAALYIAYDLFTQ